MASSSVTFLTRDDRSDNEESTVNRRIFNALIYSRKAELTALLFMNKKMRHTLPVVYAREATA